MLTSSAGAIFGGIYGTVSGVAEQTADDAARSATTNPNPIGQLKDRAPVAREYPLHVNANMSAF